jgi:putative membrane protein
VTAAALVLAGLGYGLGVRRYDAAHPAGPFPRRAVASFAAGLAAVSLAVLGPVEALAVERFSWHMVQHLLLTMAAPPLLLLGRPVSLARRTAPAPIRRGLVRAMRSRAFTVAGHPVVAWVLFAVVLWASHFTSLYERALESEAMHVLEHGLYLGAGLLFWHAVVAAEPARHRLGYAGRLLYLFLAAAASALLASTLLQSGRVLYPAYAGAGALQDQRAAAAVMWMVGGLVFLSAALLLAASWARHDRARTSLITSPPATDERTVPGGVGPRGSGVRRG